MINLLPDNYVSGGTNKGIFQGIKCIISRYIVWWKILLEFKFLLVCINVLACTIIYLNTYFNGLIKFNLIKVIFIFE